MLRVREQKDGIVLSIKLQPLASRNEVCGCQDGSLKIKIVAPPREGKANKECIKVLSRLIGIAKSNIKIIAGEKSRKKEVLITEISKNELRNILKDQNIEI